MVKEYSLQQMVLEYSTSACKNWSWAFPHAIYKKLTGN